VQFVHPVEVGVGVRTASMLPVNNLGG